MVEPVWRRYYPTWSTHDPAWLSADVMFANNPNPPNTGGMYFGGWSGRTQRDYDIERDVHGVIDDGWSVHCNLPHTTGFIGRGTAGPIHRAGASERRPRGWIAGWVMCTGAPFPVWEHKGGRYEWYVPGLIFSVPRRYWLDVETLANDPARPNRSPFKPECPPRFQNGERLYGDDGQWLLNKLHPDVRGWLKIHAEHLYGEVEYEDLPPMAMVV